MLNIILACVLLVACYVDITAFGAAIDAHRRAGNSLKAVACLTEMQRAGMVPSAAHYNLIIRTLRAEGYLDKMFKMVVTMSLKEDVQINRNTFELVIEALLEANKWKEALVLVRAMDKLSYKPSTDLCVSLVEQLERARQYKAALAMYRYMVRNGYEFYENSVINGIFKRLLAVAAQGAKVDLIQSSVPALDEFAAESAAAADLAGSNDSLSDGTGNIGYSGVSGGKG